jgi:hypothetical protein
VLSDFSWICFSAFHFNIILQYLPISKIMSAMCSIHHILPNFWQNCELNLWCSSLCNCLHSSLYFFYYSSSAVFFENTINLCYSFSVRRHQFSHQYNSPLKVILLLILIFNVWERRLGDKNILKWNGSRVSQIYSVLKFHHECHLLV